MSTRGARSSATRMSAGNGEVGHLKTVIYCLVAGLRYPGVAACRTHAMLLFAADVATVRLHSTLRALYVVAYFDMIV